ncbi:hypothetical protein RJT34_29621 [Clitoria ternatea]|uniref:Uncharacterized protein n=1 Tax=Clitoria ternatea TaxID=43366 RepID=A0AAN9I6J5_CLITE
MIYTEFLRNCLSRKCGSYSSINFFLVEACFAQIIPKKLAAEERQLEAANDIVSLILLKIVPLVKQNTSKNNDSRNSCNKFLYMII